MVVYTSDVLIPLTLMRSDWPLNEAQSDFVLKVLEVSQDRNDLVTVMDMVGQYDLMTQMSLKKQVEVSELLTREYYPKTALNTIYSQMLRWEKGQSISNSGIQSILKDMYKARIDKEQKQLIDRAVKDNFTQLSQILKRF